eukprot:scaffold102225_cov30-Phaeocystis_antarctica.AAC.1
MPLWLSKQPGAKPRVGNSEFRPTRPEHAVSVVPWGAAEGAAGARQEAQKVRAPTVEAALVAAARVVAAVAAV